MEDSSQIGPNSQARGTIWQPHSEMWSLGKLDPVHYPVVSVLAYLQKCFFAGVASATLRVYVAAIAAEHVPLQGVSIRDILCFPALFMDQGG